MMRGASTIVGMHTLQMKHVALTSPAAPIALVQRLSSTCKRALELMRPSIRGVKQSTQTVGAPAVGAQMRSVQPPTVYVLEGDLGFESWYCTKAGRCVDEY